MLSAANGLCSVKFIHSLRAHNTTIHDLLILFSSCCFFFQPIPKPGFPVNPRQSAVFKNVLENFCRFVSFWVSENGYLSICNNNKAMSNVYLSYSRDHLLHFVRLGFPSLPLHLAPSWLILSTI